MFLTSHFARGGRNSECQRKQEGRMKKNPIRTRVKKKKKLNNKQRQKTYCTVVIYSWNVYFVFPGIMLIISPTGRNACVVGECTTKSATIGHRSVWPNNHYQWLVWFQPVFWEEKITEYYNHFFFIFPIYFFYSMKMLIFFYLHYSKYTFWILPQNHKISIP